MHRVVSTLFLVMCTSMTGCTGTETTLFVCFKDKRMIGHVETNDTIKIGLPCKALDVNRNKVYECDVCADYSLYRDGWTHRNREPN